MPSKSNIDASKSIVCPVAFKVNLPLVELIEIPLVLVADDIVIPSAPVNVNEPELVEKLEFVLASKLIEPFVESSVIFLLVSISIPPALAANLIAD